MWLGNLVGDLVSYIGDDQPSVHVQLQHKVTRLEDQGLDKFGSKEHHCVWGRFQAGNDGFGQRNVSVSSCLYTRTCAVIGFHHSAAHEESQQSARYQVLFPDGRQAPAPVLF